MAAFAPTTLDFDKLDELARTGAGAFSAAKPFPHIVIDDFLPVEDAEAVREEFDAVTDGWDFYHHYNEKKQAITSYEQMGPRVQALVDALHSPRFVDWLEQITSVGDLIVDPDLDGAGMHKTLPGGHLNVHTDFLSHTQKRHWGRQLNLLLYLNKDWKPEWGGSLELWDDDLTTRVQAFEPIFNRCVIFRTKDPSFHGHPQKLESPPGVDRKSIALYYYRDEGHSLELRPTHYRSVSGDSALHRFLIAADAFALRSYSFLKRYTKLSDGVISRILKHF